MNNAMKSDFWGYFWWAGRFRAWGVVNCGQFRSFSLF